MEQFKLFLIFSEGFSTLPRFKQHKNTWPHTWKTGLAAELLWSAKTGQGGCCQRVQDWQGMKEVVSLWWKERRKKWKDGQAGEAGGGGCLGWKTTAGEKSHGGTEREGRGGEKRGGGGGKDKL